jgi:hypothetical protein
MATDDDREERFNPKRRLCPDGTCIGIIGADGKCAECGAPAAGESESGAEEPPATNTLESDDEVELPREESSADSEDGPAFDPKRRLCSDGTCIGVIGSNNRCQVCGRPAD